MFILGLNGSPRKKGNTEYLLDQFMSEAQKHGAHTQIIHVDQRHILPCKEYIVCEKKGFCPIKDDMKSDIYSLLRHADGVVLASPIFFYNVTAQLKALIDRSQTLWARHYQLKYNDPWRDHRQGYMLAVGATKGKNLFEGVTLTAKYFFDAIGANYAGELTYRHVEHPGDIAQVSSLDDDIKKAVKTFLDPLLNRKHILFISQADSCRTQIAKAILQNRAGNKVLAKSAGIAPEKSIPADLEKILLEKGLDMAFYQPRPLDPFLGGKVPDLIISFGQIDIPAKWTQIPHENWQLKKPTNPAEYNFSVDKLNSKMDAICQQLEIPT